MNEIELCKKLQEKLKLQGINTSLTDIGNLYISTLLSIDKILDEGNTVDFVDFGSFWRKNGSASAVTFFRPVDKLTDRINSR